MVVIRLSRGGAKGRPFFNIVVADKRTRRDGRFIERLGFYNPSARGGEESLRLTMDRLNYWKSVGAQPSPTVARLVKQAAKQLATTSAAAPVVAAAAPAVATAAAVEAETTATEAVSA